MKGFSHFQAKMCTKDKLVLIRNWVWCSQAICLLECDFKKLS